MEKNAMRALVIDDARTMRMILRQILQKIGFEVTEASNGHEGLEQLREFSRPDVVLVDGQMPVMDGLAFIQAVRADPIFHDLHLIMVTAEDEQAQVAKAIATGADDYIIKPFNKEIIRTKLERLGITASHS